MWKKLVAVVIGVLAGCWLIDDFNPDEVKGKKVLLTGASTGIGEQMAYHYARLGASIVVTARRENRLKEVVAKCRELGPPDQTYGYIVADMTDLNATSKVIQNAVKKLGRLDVLVLNHITLLDLGYWDGSPHNLSLIDRVMKVNFESYVYLASHSLPHLEASNGSIVVVSSLAGKLGQPFVSIYSGSKFALDGFFSGLRQELKIRNSQVSVTLCILGLIGTDNAINQLLSFGQRDLINSIQAASPSDTALAMIKGGATRSREVFYPKITTMFMVTLRDLCTSLVEFINRSVYSNVS